MGLENNAVAVCLLLMVFSATAGNEGCFERIAVGHRIAADKVIASNVSGAITLTLCKQACQQRGPLCASFAFGIGNQLEATCDLGAALWNHVPIHIQSTSTVKLSADNSSEPPQAPETPPATQNATKKEEEKDPESLLGDTDVDFDLYIRRPSSICERSPVGESSGILRPLPTHHPSPIPSSVRPPPPSVQPSTSTAQPTPPSVRTPPPSVRTPPSTVRPSPPSASPPPTSPPSRYPSPSVHLKPPPLFQPSAFPPLPPMRPTPTPTYLPYPPAFRPQRPWPPTHFPDCFRRVGMGRLLPDNFVHRTVPSVGLEQCRLACTMEHQFRCEGFVYRWDENLCQLTAAPLSSLEFRNLDGSDRVEYFARDGPCMSSSYPPKPQSNHVGSLPGFYGTARPDSPLEQTVREEGISWSGASHFPHSGDRYPSADASANMWKKQPQECFVLVKRGFRLTSDSSNDHTSKMLFLSMRVRSRSPEDCAKECFQSRLFQCRAFSYRFNGDPRTQGLSNCDLSGSPLQNLDPYQDLMQDRDYDVYGKTKGRACGDDSIMMASLEIPLQNAFPPSRSPPSTPPPPPPPYLDNSLGPGSSWSTDIKEQVSDVTVGGLPCAPGTSCKRHPDGGFWGCPVAKTQGKNAGKDWDYCCRPGHQCGYSEGYHLPWCYVGSADRDQWRPCSQSQGSANVTKADHGITNTYAYLQKESHNPVVTKETTSVTPSYSEEVKDSVIRKVYDILKSGIVDEGERGKGNSLETVNKRSRVRDQKGNRTFGRRADEARYFRTSAHRHSSMRKL